MQHFNRNTFASYGLQISATEKHLSMSNLLSARNFVSNKHIYRHILYTNGIRHPQVCLLTN